MNLLTITLPYATKEANIIIDKSLFSCSIYLLSACVERGGCFSICFVPHFSIRKKRGE